MQTVLSQFCEEFERAVRPLLEPVKRSSDVLSAASQGVGARSILPGLLDVRHQLRALADKVAEQQAYVLIFGPLKSGKSTLMNAMAGTYVSEVTSLPAYPCMVYVSHSDTREYVLTPYNGEPRVLHDAEELRKQVDGAHAELAKRIREVEAEGETFDAAIHLPSAIRRFDVKLPAGDLARSGAVLVDTPGLYSRMKFGYAHMTREFRDTAACAIFVVKTDNLFLEQVFEEFNELLELFSRIFLVVNLDSTKVDLRPDGSLVPSLEQEDPQRIIEAFRNLAMTNPLRLAAEEGRLKIYPVDLLRAASARLKGESLETATLRNGKAGSHPAFRGFESFMGDLGTYLNSTGYLADFLGDSLRHAGNLLGELRGMCSEEPVQVLAREVQDLEADQVRANDHARVLRRLSDFGWDKAFETLPGRLLASAREKVQPLRGKTAMSLGAAVDAWFNDGSSLQALLEERVAPVLESCSNEMTRTALQVLDAIVSGPEAAGVQLPAGILGDLKAAAVDLDGIARAEVQAVVLKVHIRDEVPALLPTTIPVRKAFLDRLLLRSDAKVQKRIFGPSSKPATDIPKSVKARQLGANAREALRQSLHAHLESFFPRALKRIVQEISDQYAATVLKNLKAALEERVQRNAARLAQIESRLGEVAAIRTALAELEAGVAGVTETLEDITRRYGETDPSLLVQPAESLRTVELAPGAPRVADAPAAPAAGKPAADPSVSRTTRPPG